MAYALTWSATRRRLEADGTAWFDEAVQALQAVWGNPLALRRVSMPLHILGGRRGPVDR